MKFTIFQNRQAQTKTELDMLWDEFITYLKDQPEYDNKMSMPLVKMAVFGELRSQKNCLRIDKNIQYITGVECDYDKGVMSMEDAYLALLNAGIKCVIKTSARYTKESPRWHVIAPLSRDTPRIERAALVGKINAILREVLEVESFRDSQTFHIGALNGYLSGIWPIEGEFIDRLNIIPAIPATLPVKVDESDIRSYPVELATDDQIADLRSALKFLSDAAAMRWNNGDKSAYSYHEWVAMGNRLFNPDDDRMYQLFYDWSRASIQHYPPTMDTGTADAICEDVCREKWDNHLACDRTGFQAVFVQAQMLGWTNPKARVELDPLEVGFGKSGFTVNEEVDALDILKDKVDFYGWPIKSDKGKIVSCYENWKYFCKSYGITCHYDVLKKDQGVNIPSATFTDNANSLRQVIIQALNLNDAPRCMVDNLDVTSEFNKINPVKDWITSKPWDGIDRLTDLFNTVTVNLDMVVYRNEIMRMWMIQSIAAMDGAETTPISHAIQKFESILIFQGAQGKNKTKWVMGLVPEALRSYIKPSLTLDIDNKDSVLRALSHWIVELGELDATFKKSDISRLKSFLSNDVDKIRLPYDRKSTNINRTTSFIASVNDPQFLVDDTGNRRMFVLEILEINLTALYKIDLQQLWAQCWHEYCCGATWWPDEDLTAKQTTFEKRFHADCPIEQDLWNHFDLTVKPKKPHGECLNPTAMLKRCGHITPKKADINKAAKYLRKLGFEKEYSSTGLSVYRLKSKI